MATMQARYPGKCAVTGRRFPAGATIDYSRATRRAVLISMPETSAEETAEETAGAYLARRTRSAGYRSNVFTTSGGTFYRNKSGRCEDAPCCGCCTI